MLKTRYYFARQVSVQFDNVNKDSTCENLDVKGNKARYLCIFFEDIYFYIQFSVHFSYGAFIRILSLYPK